ncbi:unnamed protein product [Orchesella dallaii]|uniref:Odorant receptor n=1 Tax=Orchesella dallaii TaxID=48710 RepID=A0ABP1RJI9_9HEXA
MSTTSHPTPVNGEAEAEVPASPPLPKAIPSKSEISELTWNSLALLDRAYFFMHPMPYNWQNNKFHFRGWSELKCLLVPHFFVIFFTLFAGTILCGGLLIAHFQHWGTISLPMINILTFPICAMVSTLTCIAEMVCFAYGSEFESYLNRLRALEIAFQAEVVAPASQNMSESAKKRKIGRERKSEYIGSMLCFLMFAFPIGVVPLVLGGTAFHLDPFYFIAEAYFLPQAEYRSILVILGFWLARFFVNLLMLLEVSRMALLGVAIMPAMVQIYRIILDTMMTDLGHVEGTRGRRILGFYTQLDLIHNIAQTFVSIVLAINMMTGLVLMVLMSWATFKAYGILPLELYWICPIGVVGIPVFIHATLPQAAHVHDESKELIERWKIVSRDWKREDGRRDALVRKRLQSCRPVFWCCGGWFRVKHSTMVTYVMAIVDRVVDALLGIHVD